MPPFIQNIIIAGGIVLIVILGYYIYTSSVDVQEDEVSLRVAAETEEFLRRLNELKAVKLDGSIFSDPRFISLINYTAPVLPEPIGRTNPFEVSN